jgi:hypothetical protein
LSTTGSIILFVISFSRTRKTRTRKTQKKKKKTPGNS